jgi:hypothetical protein
MHEISAVSAYESCSQKPAATRAGCHVSHLHSASESTSGFDSRGSAIAYVSTVTNYVQYVGKEVSPEVNFQQKYDLWLG